MPWKVVNNAPVMATAGDLLFQGGPNEGVMRAFNASTGADCLDVPDGQQLPKFADQLRRAGRPAVCGDHREPAGSQTRRCNPMPPRTRISGIRRSGATLYVFALPRVGGAPRR